MRDRLYIFVVLDKLIWAVCFILSFSILYMYKVQNSYVIYANLWVSSVMRTSVDFVYTPIADGLGYLTDSAKTIRQLRIDISKLQVENQSLTLNRINYEKLLEENKKLHQLLKMSDSIPYQLVTARALLVSVVNPSSTFILTSGSSQGVKRRNPVMSPNGIVGQIISVSDDYSRMMMLTSSNSKVSAFVGEEQLKAIVVGDGTNYPQLLLLQESKNIKIGDRIVTSGVESNFPPFLSIGTVFKDKKGDLRVKLFTPIEEISYVYILKTQFEDLLEKED